jgi:hypothetical protein
MKWPYLVSLGVVSYWVALALTMPAATALAWVDISPVKVSGVRGSLFRGSADLVEPTAGQRLQNLRWTFSPLALVKGQVAMELDFLYRGGQGTGRAGYGLSRELEITDGHFEIPAKVLQDLLPLPLAEFGGVLDANLERVGLAAGKLKTVRGELLWRKAALRAPVKADLGEVRMEVAPSGQGHRAQLKGKGGVLDMDGEVDLDAGGDDGGQYRANIEFRPQAGASKELTDALRNIARPERDGRFRLRYTGRIGDFL